MMLVLAVQENQKFLILNNYHVASPWTGGRHDYKRDDFRSEWQTFIVHGRFTVYTLNFKHFFLVSKNVLLVELVL